MSGFDQRGSWQNRMGSGSGCQGRGGFGGGYRGGRAWRVRYDNGEEQKKTAPCPQQSSNPPTQRRYQNLRVQNQVDPGASESVKQKVHRTEQQQYSRPKGSASKKEPGVQTVSSPTSSVAYVKQKNPYPTCGDTTHSSRNCLVEVYCEICAKDTHVTEKCVWPFQPKPIAKMVASAAQGLGYFLAQNATALKKDTQTNTLGVVVMKVGSLTANQLESAFHETFPGEWLWNAREMGSNSFLVRFPTAEKLDEVSRFHQFAVTESGVSVKVSRWTSATMAKYKLHVVWVRASGVPDDLKNYYGLCEVGSMLGSVMEVDMHTLRVADVIRIKIAVKNIMNIPTKAEICVLPYLYDIHFDVDSVVESGGFLWGGGTVERSSDDKQVHEGAEEDDDRNKKGPKNGNNCGNACLDTEMAGCSAQLAGGPSTNKQAAQTEADRALAENLQIREQQKLLVAQQQQVQKKDGIFVQCSVGVSSTDWAVKEVLEGGQEKVVGSHQRINFSYGEDADLEGTQDTEGFVMGLRVGVSDSPSQIIDHNTIMTESRDKGRDAGDWKKVQQAVTSNLRRSHRLREYEDFNITDKAIEHAQAKDVIPDAGDHKHFIQSGRSLWTTQMEDKLDLPENKLRDFIQGIDKAKWRADNNHKTISFAENEIKRITSNYSTILGSGAFGEVYKGVLDDGRAVAVKRYKSIDPAEEFAKEAIVHSQINHRNVVRLIGCCIERNAPMMVFEYASNGTLHGNLHGCNTLLSLDTRLSIAIQCAEALWCMHSMYNPVLHGDIKPSNILLDDNFHAKISDFGISKLLSGDNYAQLTGNVKGSFGYMDPVLYQEGRLTTKSDVYSLGVVLLELITGKKAMDGEINLAETFTEAYAKGKGVRKLFDANITDESNMKILEGIGKIASDCLKKHIDERPEMIDIAARLRELRATLEQGQVKAQAGWRLFSRSQNALKNESQHGTNNVGSSSALYKMKSRGIFSRNVTYLKRNDDQILQNYINNIKIFTKEELENITCNFSTVLGKGAFGQAYLGVVDENTKVEVKSSILINETREEFVNKLAIQSQMNHTNITKLLGCCLEMDLPISVYEYVPNGSLEKYLSEAPLATGAEQQLDQWPLLDLNTRYQIALEVARAIVYLHEECPEPVLHCDIKPRNILLDDHFNPKVSNLGQSMLLSKQEEEVKAWGTIGYIAPEWFIHSTPMTAKADVYSFGMVLLQIISGWASVTSRDGRFLHKWAYEKVCLERQIEDILDPRIIQAKAYDGVDSLATVERMVKTAMWCIQSKAEKRPSMGEVVQMIEGNVKITEPENPTIDDQLLTYSD